MHIKDGYSSTECPYGYPEYIEYAEEDEKYEENRLHQEYDYDADVNGMENCGTRRATGKDQRWENCPRLHQELAQDAYRNGKESRAPGRAAGTNQQRDNRAGLHQEFNHDADIDGEEN